MAKNNYNKKRIEINHWFVTSEDIALVHSFFRERFGIDNFEIEIETVSGNNKICENYEEFCNTLNSLSKDRELIENIKIIHREQEDNNVNFKQVWIEIPFKGEFYKPYMSIMGGDNDGSYSDWIEGTYNKAKKMMESFSEEDEVIKRHLEDKKIATVLDLDSSIKKKIIMDEKEKDDERASNNSINTTTLNNYGQIGGSGNYQKITNNKQSSNRRFYETWWFKYIISPLIVLLIATLIGLNN